MLREAAMLAASCVLFINMGLSDAVQEKLGIRLSFLSCVKCLCFWSTFIFLLACGCRVVTAVGTAFLFSYVALWADLGLSMLNKKYNEIYKQLSEPDSTKNSSAQNPKKNSPGVSAVREKN